MKIKTFTAVLLLFLSFQLSYSQSVRKIIVNSPLSLQRILPGDIIVGNFNGSFSGSSIIGYSFRNNVPNPVIGILGIHDNGTIQFSKNFTVPSQQLFEVRKIISSGEGTEPFYVLASLQSSTQPAKFMPVILKLDRLNGNILDQYFLNIPNNEEIFVPTDIAIKSGKLLVLCVGINLNASSGVNQSSVYFIELNIQLNTFSCTRIYNPANLSGIYGLDLNFIKGAFHYGGSITGNLSFYGLEKNLASGNNRGVAFIRDNTSDRGFAFSINGAPTYSIQINNVTGQQTIAVQNSLGQLYLENSTALLSTNWSKKISRNFPLFYLYGLGHGAKAASTDYLLGQFRQPGSGGSGYSFLRYTPANGNLQQTYSYDLNIDFGWTTGYGYARSYYNDKIYNYYFIGECKSMTSLPQQYFYFISNPLNIDQTNCTETIVFDDDNFPVTRSQVNLTFNTYVTNQAVSNPNISTINIPPPTIQSVCVDQEGLVGGREGIYDPLTTSGLINFYLLHAPQHRRNVTSTQPSSEIEIKKNNQLVVLEAKTKRITGGNVFNINGQLIKRLSLINDKTIQINQADFKFNQIGFVQLIFADGSMETKKIVF